MSVTVSAAVGAAVAANVALQSAAARRACEASMPTFQHEGASVAEMRSYSSCVQRLYPSPMSDDSIMVAKACVFVLIAAFVAGLIWGWFDNSFGSRLASMGMNAIGWLTCAAAGLLAIAGLWFGIKFLFS
jgi:hypothetical protein